MSYDEKVNPEVLKQYIAQIQSLEHDKAKIMEDLKEVYLSAKEEGMEPKILKQIVKELSMPKRERDEHEHLSELLDVYRQILGMI